MQSAHDHRAGQLVGCLLISHPEARSLLGEASHWRILAGQSSATAGWYGQILAAARLELDELRRRLDPRGCRPIAHSTGWALAGSIAIALTALSWIDLAGLASGLALAVAAAATAAVWICGAWLAASARPRRSRPTRAAVACGVILGVLLATLHWLSQPVPLRGLRPLADTRVLGLGVFCAAASLVLAVSAAALIVRTEPPALAAARRRLRRAREDYAAAIHSRQADAEIAEVARRGWLGLVQAEAAAVVGERDGGLVREAIELAAALI